MHLCCILNSRIFLAVSFAPLSSSAGPRPGPCSSGVQTHNLRGRPGLRNGVIGLPRPRRLWQARVTVPAAVAPGADSESTESSCVCHEAEASSWARARDRA